MGYDIQLRGVVGEAAGPPSDSVWGEVPTLDPNGVPRLDVNWGGGQLSEGGRAWRLGATVVNAGMRVLASVNPPGDPGEPFDYMYVIDAESDSLLLMVITSQS